MILIPNSDQVTMIVANWFQDPELGILMGGHSVPKPLKNIMEYLTNFYDGVNNLIIGVWDETKNILGGAYFVHITDACRRAEIHHVFLKEYRGKFSIRAYYAIIDYFKNQLRLLILYGMFATSNLSPANYLVKLGWKKAGVLPKYFITSKGQEDSHVYYLELA